MPPPRRARAAPAEGCALPSGAFLLILAFVLVTMAAATIGEQGGHSRGNRVVPWVKCLRVVSAALSPGSAAPAESGCPWPGKKAGETAGRFLVRVQEAHTYRYVHTHACM